MRKIIPILIVLILVATGCASGGSYTKNAVETTTDTAWIMSYQQFDGTKTNTVTLGEGETAMFTVAVVTDDGALGITITGADGTEYYTGKDMPTTSFTVNADQPGPYEIRVDAKRHRGGFTVTWEPME